MKKTIRTKALAIGLALFSLVSCDQTEKKTSAEETKPNTTNTSEEEESSPTKNPKEIPAPSKISWRTLEKALTKTGFSDITPHATRFSKDEREQAGTKAGFPATTQDAVLKTLRYLHETQSGDGSWGKREKTRVTALVLLTFLSHGETPLSGEFGGTVTNGLTYLIGATDPRLPKLDSLDNSLIALALVESFNFSSSVGINMPKHQERTAQFLNLLIKDSNGRPSEEIAAPLLHALWLGRQGPLEIANLDETLNSALNSISSTTTGSNELAFVYSLATPSGAPSATLAVQAVTANPLMKREDLASWRGLLSLHYGALAVSLSDDPKSTQWFSPRIEGILKLQNADGSFKKPLGGDQKDSPDDAILHTALSCLILQTPWRYDVEN